MEDMSEWFRRRFGELYSSPNRIEYAHLGRAEILHIPAERRHDFHILFKLVCERELFAGALDSAEVDRIGNTSDEFVRTFSGSVNSLVHRVSRSMGEPKVAEALANLAALADYIEDLDRALLWETRDAFSLPSFALAQTAKSRPAQIPAVVAALDRVIESITAAMPHPDYAKELEQTLQYIAPLSAALHRRLDFERDKPKV